MVLPYQFSPSLKRVVMSLIVILILALGLSLIPHIVCSFSFHP